MAGELETLDQDEPLARRIARHDYDRLIMLSDGVFAIALTLLALELRPPQLWDGTIHGLLAERWRSLAAFGCGFGVIAGFWTAHRRLFAQLRGVDLTLTALALLLLALVSVTPFVASLMTEHGPARGMPFYLLLVSGISITQGSIHGYAAFRAGLLDPSITLSQRRLRTAQLFLPLALAGVFVVGLRSSEALTLALIAPILAVAVLANREERRLRAANAAARP
jgi:uncharacterized membrane protein